MRKSVSVSLCVAGFLFAVADASAATLIPVPSFPGSVETDVYGINDENVIVGNYYDKKFVAHGFFGTLDGNYTAVKYKKVGTVLRAINNSGEITGISNSDSGHCASIEFERAPDGSIKAIKKDGQGLNGVVHGINSKGQFVGDYCMPDGSELGFIGANGKYKSAIVIDADTSKTQPRAINKSGFVVGSFLDGSGHSHAFSLKNGVTNVIDYPDASVMDTSLMGLNDKGMAAGFWDNSNFVWHPFTLNTKNGTFTEIDVPGAGFGQAFGINSAGLVPIITDNGSYIFCPTGATCPGGGVTIAVHPVHVSPARFLRYERAAAAAHTVPHVVTGHYRDVDGMRH